mgnify:CR=1 FL=1
MKQIPLSSRLLTTPQCIISWDELTWDLLIQQGYASGLLARMYNVLSTEKLLEHIPKHIIWHFESAYKLYQAHYLDVVYEMDKLSQALNVAGIMPVFLKGAGYIASRDNSYFGRLFADVDIYIPKNKIASAEQMLKWQGWESKKLDDYDESYYRKWMHEIPPMSHKMRGMTLDVHHSLTPLTSKMAMDVEKLEKKVVLSNETGYQTLSPEDRVLHSAIHLLLDSEFSKGFRDLSDLDIMLREFSGKNSDFWCALVSRAEDLAVGRVLYYCLMSCHQIFETPIPDEVIKQIKGFSPSKIVNKIMLTCFYAVLLPNHNSCVPRYINIANNILFLRSHWLKMPMHILIPHLFHKSFITPFTEWNKQQKETEQNLKG